jgi:V8-like Glu-specific endopeptidase
LDATDLVRFACDQGTNPDDARYTFLAGLLEALYDDLDLEGQRWVAALIAAKGLYQDDGLMEDIMMRYQVPWAASDIGIMPRDMSPGSGPEIEWEGPDRELELQGFLRPEPDLHDIGFLKQAIERAASVCRVEIPEGKPEGTGFLVAPTLLLTNYHVLDGQRGLDIEERAQQATLRFGAITAENGEEAKGQTFQVVGEPLAASPATMLDYALLRVEDRILKSVGIEHAPYTLETPYEGMAINILQHPKGQPLKLGISGDGVDRVFAKRGLVQYSTRAWGGSSGAACFTDEWKVIALHHAERRRSFGAIREGIIFSSIYQEIKDEIKQHQ